MESGPVEALVISHTHGWSNFGVKCIERFPELWGKVKLLLLGFPTTYFSEQGFCRKYCTGHARKYRNRLAMNKIGETPFMLTNGQPALKKLADTRYTIATLALVGMSCFFGNE